MAQRGTPLRAFLITQLQRLRAVLGIKATARTAGVDRNTVRKYARNVPLHRAA